MRTPGRPVPAPPPRRSPSPRLGLAALAVLAALAGACGSGPSAAQPSGPYRSVLFDGHFAVCARVFRTAAQHRQGLSGPHAPAAGAFLNDPAQQPSLWMHDVTKDLVGVWVGAGGRILGSVQMKAETATLHPAPAPVPLILELSPGLWRRWSGSTTASLGGACRP